MCEYLDYRVTKLKRVRIMNIHLDLPMGQWRYLTADEIAEIQSMVSDSAKVVDSTAAGSHEGSPSASLFLKSRRLIPYLCSHLFS